ncbi:TetR/AcrR family transcriptional regulator [Actinoplanes sp. L3-i22]|uniref:TetR/AcrR family transcriptional regulator n=1 Tax=Actinoplanes sp. L3-i22 TaxID=2836373 RepID=UPI001C78D897|nr:TetR family transcriptional regulator [Actinoplanes sp. L3-i22]BCY12395.1 TetR family transcriptional regulator [Actinoplanes sp. L3-i22]
MGITSLRDRKREQSRIATVRAAWQLFIERGYDNVTVGDICAKAEIAPRTFHRYFASKEDVVAEPVRQMTTIVTEYLSAGAPDGADDRAVMRGAMIRVAEFVVERRELLVALRTVAQQSAHLQVSAVVVRTDSDPNIAALLAARTPGADPGDWRRRLLVGCVTQAFRIWYEDFLPGDLPDPMSHLTEIMDAAVTGFSGPLKPQPPTDVAL